MPLFSVIIPTCNRNEMLGLCLERLAPGSQTMSALQYQVIVTDDGAGEGAEAYCKTNFPWIFYTHGPKRGPAANRNNGAQKAVGEWLVFTDDDCLPDANWLSAYAEGINLHPECSAFEGAILPNDWNLLKKDMAECPVNTNGECFWSANILVKSKLFHFLNGFNEEFKIPAMEDKEFYERVRNQTNVSFLADASVIHPVRIMSLRGKLKKLPESLQNWYLFEKGKNNFFHIFLKGFRFQATAFIGHLKSKKFKAAFYNATTIIILLPEVLYLKIKNV